MEQYLWIVWLILGVSLIVAEIFTLGFFLLWFGVAAIAAGIVGLAGGGLFLQFLAFVVVSIALTAMSRTIFSRYFQLDEKSAVKTGVDALPGKVGVVVEPSRGAMGQGAVKVFGSTWTAYPIDGENELAEGEKVEVVEVRGSSIYVRRFSNELPEWRRGSE